MKFNAANVYIMLSVIFLFTLCCQSDKAPLFKDPYLGQKPPGMNPEKFAPQYGGYCAWAVGHDLTAKGDPQQWTIINDKLYLNYDDEIKNKWSAEPEKWIVEGDKNWPDVLNR